MDLFHVGDTVIYALARYETNTLRRDRTSRDLRHSNTVYGRVHRHYGQLPVQHDDRPDHTNRDRKARLQVLLSLCKLTQSITTGLNPG